MLPDILLAVAIFLALVAASVVLAQSVADTAVWQAEVQSASFQKAGSGPAASEVDAKLQTDATERGLGRE